jgi:ribosomal-protein-alanine N-acetyltransferase
LDCSDILTERLRLTAITLPMLRAGLTHLGELSRLVHAEIPVAWPPEHWEPHVFEFLEKQLAESPHTAGWNRYVVLRDPQPVLIGTLGAFPKSGDEAEFGYSILPEWQGRGLATEGAQALIANLFERTLISAMSAQTFPDLRPSLRVMEKCGLRYAGDGDEPGTVRYRIERPAPV